MSNKKKVEQAYQDFTEQESRELVLDLDEALEEHKKTEQPIQVKLFDKHYEVPPNLPVSVFFFYQRHVDKDGNIPEDKAFQYLELILGKDFCRDLEKSDVTVTFVMEKVVPMITEKWGVDSKKKSNGKAKASTPKR